MNLIKRFLKNNELILSVALFLSLTVGFFGPSHVFLTNQLEFNYLYIDIVWNFIVISLGIFLILLLIMFFIEKLNIYKKKSFIFFFGIGFLVWFQGNFNVRDMGVFDGRVINWSEFSNISVLDTFTWLTLFILFLLFSNFLFIRMTKISLFLVLFQFTYFIYILLTFKVDLSYLKYETELSNKYNFSKEKNIIVLLLDTVRSDVFYEILEENNEYRDKLFGFKYYIDTMGGYPTTYPSVPLIFTGSYYKNEIPIQSFIKDRYMNNSILKSLRDIGYITEVYGGKNTIFYDESIISNIFSKNENGFFKLDFKSVSFIYDIFMYRSSPMGLKEYIYNDGNFWFNGFFKKNGNKNIVSIDYSENVAFINEFVDKANKVNKSPVFKYYYLWGAHPPFDLTKDLKLKTEDKSFSGYKEQTRAMLHLVDLFLNKLREIDSFNNSMIVILADHGSNINMEGDDESITDRDNSSGEIGKYVLDAAKPLLLIKPFGSNSDELQIDTSEASLMDVSKTILSSVNADSKDMEGVDLLNEISNINDRERNFYCYTWTRDGSKKEYLPDMVEYSVNGNSWNYNSWTNTGIIHSFKNQKKNLSYNYSLGEMITFGTEGNGENYLLGGWTNPALDFVWSDAKKASLKLQLNNNLESDVDLKARLNPFFNQEVFMYVNNVVVGEWKIDTFGEYEVTIPKNILSDGELVIDFVLPNATKTPKDLGMSEDVRKLGIAIYNLELN